MDEKPFSIRDLNGSNIKVDDNYQQISGPFNIRNLDGMTSMGLNADLQSIRESQTNTARSSLSTMDKKEFLFPVPSSKKNESN